MRLCGVVIGLTGREAGKGTAVRYCLGVGVGLDSVAESVKGAAFDTSDSAYGYSLCESDAYM